MNIIMLLLVISAIYTIGFEAPMQLSYYSPIVEMAPRWGEMSVPVYGRVMTQGGNDTLIPLASIIVRLFGTDDFLEDVVFTDAEGYFYSEIDFKNGQIIKVSVGGKNFQRFIDYDASELYDLGVFIV